MSGRASHDESDICGSTLSRTCTEVCCHRLTIQELPVTAAKTVLIPATRGAPGMVPGLRPPGVAAANHRASTAQRATARVRNTSPSTTTPLEPGEAVAANLCASTAQRATANVRFIVRRTTTHPIQRPTSATKRGQCTMAPTRLQRFGSSKLARMACGRQVMACWVLACTVAESCRRLKPTHHAMDRDLVSSLSFA